MRGLLFLLAICFASMGCTGKPKREMPQKSGEDFPVLPADYGAPREFPRDQPILQQKSTGPGMNTSSPGLPTAGGPGGPPGSMPGNRR
jgi:hypothetical protein